MSIGGEGGDPGIGRGQEVGIPVIARLCGCRVEVAGEAPTQGGAYQAVGGGRDETALYGTLGRCIPPVRPVEVHDEGGVAHAVVGSAKASEARKYG